jgi:hypothetical protein
MAAYRRTSKRIEAVIADCVVRRSPANRWIPARKSSEAGIVAMQKVEGSNPFSRFFENALHVGGLASARVAEIKWNHPAYRRYSRH